MNYELTIEWPNGSTDIHTFDTRHDGLKLLQELHEKYPDLPAGTIVTIKRL